MNALDGLPAHVAYPTLALVMRRLTGRLRKRSSRIEDWPETARRVIEKLRAAEQRALIYDLTRLSQAPGEEQNLAIRSLGWQDRFTTTSHDTGETVIEVLLTCHRAVAVRIDNIHQGALL